MKVAHVLSHVSAEHAGVPIATRKMATALQKLGAEISFWTTGNDTDKEVLLKEGFSAQVFARSWPRGWRYAPGFTDALTSSSKDINLLHIHEVWDYPQLSATRVAAKAGIPYLWAPRASLEPWRMRYKSWKKKAYFSLFGAGMMKRAACMHAVSPAEVEGFRLLGFRGPVTVVPNGISLAEFKTIPDPALAEQFWPELVGRRVVLYLSRLSPEKGLDQLLPAWSDLIKNGAYSDALLVLAGPDDRGYHQIILDMVNALGLQRHVLLTGMVSGERKLSLISRANIYTLPSYSEGFSGSILENMAAGVPALITPGCNFPEAVKAGGALSVKPERNAILEGLKNLLDMPDAELKKMGQRGRELILHNYTWDIAARKLITVYSAIIGGGAIPLYPEPVKLDERGKAIVS